MKLRKMLALSLAAALTVGMAVSVNAAELDFTWYAEKNADVVAQVGDSAAALQQHYDTYGRKEGRMANAHDIEAKLRRLFDAEEYAALYPDVKAAFGEDEEAMFGHYISYGLLETRRPCMKVSYEAAVALKEAVAEAMEKAGVEAVPGSGEAAAFLEGELETVAAESAATVETLTQAAAEVETAVAAAEASTVVPVSSGSSSSTGSQTGSSVGSGVTMKVYNVKKIEGKEVTLGEQIGNNYPLNAFNDGTKTYAYISMRDVEGITKSAETEDCYLYVVIVSGLSKANKFVDISGNDTNVKENEYSFSGGGVTIGANDAVFLVSDNRDGNENNSLSVTLPIGEAYINFYMVLPTDSNE